eukprot:GHRQ01029730.1.p1 GENE.GHRQ01029730.1~~GHRQ01029730.1.p1  ORF type:complete len:167 (+),score=102.67 GHRQ01029730.1:995-1495(+)
MLELCRKRSMARLLAGLAAAAPPGCSYDFFPPTWQLPGQLRDFLAAAKAAGRKATFIVKPDAGCQGKGIRLLQGGSEAAVLRSLAGMATLQAVAQAYIPRPLLVSSSSGGSSSSSPSSSGGSSSSTPTCRFARQPGRSCCTSTGHVVCEHHAGCGCCRWHKPALGL